MNILRVISGRADIDGVDSRRGSVGDVQRLEAEFLDRLLSLFRGRRESRRRVGNLVEGKGSGDAVCLFIDAASVAELERMGEHSAAREDVKIPTMFS